MHLLGGQLYEISGLGMSQNLVVPEITSKMIDFSRTTLPCIFFLMDCEQSRRDR